MALAAGVRAVQLREKDLPVRKTLDLAFRLSDICQRFGAGLLINERADIAAIVGADGTHLTSNSIPASLIRKIIPGKLVGVSTHSIEEAAIAEMHGPDYIVFGPVYETASKLKYGRPLGLDLLQAVCSETRIPVLAIGGITPRRAAECLKHGAHGVAVISSILGQEKVEVAVRNFGTIMGEL
jgi:thiamine-phosphate pyrophosphorylase